MDSCTFTTRRSGLTRSSALAGAISGLGLLLGGCFSLTQGSVADASSQFSQRFQCPIDRVSAGLEPLTVKAPPPDVAADPARLAMYNQQVVAELGSSRVIDVAGCGQAAMFRCVEYSTRHSGEQVGCAMIERGKLGISIVTATRMIDRIEPGGLGERLGFRVGDVYVGIDRRPIADMADCLRLVNDPSSPGHVLTMLRGGTQIEITVPRLGE
jgi:hypothetical protein